MNQWRHQLEFFFTIFKVNGVNNRFTLAILQRQINHLRICSIDHQRHFYLFDYQFQEQLNVFALIAVRILHTDIDHLRTALNLRPGYF
ncbi:hypothetical protein D3C71_1914630 [compost metagenome]